VRKISWILGLIAAAGLLAAAEQNKSAAAENKPEHQVFTPAGIQWVDAPAPLPAGAKRAILEGDPNKSGYFAMRLRLPDGYKIMPHWHPNVERVTVISGTLYIGEGDAFDESKGQKMPAGTYSTMLPQIHHFGWVQGETELQIATIGPWKIVYINPADDPSKAAQK